MLAVAGIYTRGGIDRGAAREDSATHSDGPAQQHAYVNLHPNGDLHGYSDSHQHGDTVKPLRQR
jgi:hypothetical protein